MTSPSGVLGVLADLAPDTKPTVPHFIARHDRALLPFDAVTAIGSGGLYLGNERTEQSERIRRTIQPFLKRAKLHDDEDLLRIGWLWVTGTSESGDHVHFPLVSAPVRLPGVIGQLLGGDTTLRMREPELTDLIDELDVRTRLEANIQYGGGATDTLGRDYLDPALLARLTRLEAWATEAAAAAGFPTRRLLSRARPSDAGIEIIAQVQVYLAAPTRRSATVASTLRSWPSSTIENSAFAALYTDTSEHEAATDEPVQSSIVLSPAQRAAVKASRTAPVTVVSGPPGTGKTQTIAAIALDAVERGTAVLVAAPGSAAVDALITLMTETPGPDPVVFGATEQRLQVADRLGQGGGRYVDSRSVDDARRRHWDAEARFTTATKSVTELLRAEQLASGGDAALTLHSRSIAPNWFLPGSDLVTAALLLDRADSTRGWLAALRRRRKLAKLRSHAGGPASGLDELRTALGDARARLALADLEQTGGLELDGLWDRVVTAEEDRRVRKGEWLNAVAHSSTRVGRNARATMASVAAALRSGRANRREQLGRLDGHIVTEALPLWIGTLRDIDDLLPRTSEMFDLVVIDEASQVDQIAAAPALLRARRAVVVGDPKQLRHVSFLSDDRIASAIAARGIADASTRQRLDVRRLSLFDLAAASAPTRFLDEHFRSAPHLIQFSARHFYDGRLTIATTHPRNQARDCISVEHVDGLRGSNGVNAVELNVVLDRLREHLARIRCGTATGNIGVISPFRDHVDAIEQAVIDEFSLIDLDDLGLRIGTVHGFQGCERDEIIVSLAIDPTSSPSSRAFLADANLFNVMITRARDHLHVVTSLEPDTRNIVGDYLRHGAAAPPLPRADRGRARRADEIAAELGRSGLPSLLGYRSGRHVLDLVVGDGDDALGVLFGVHPHGPAAHIDRHLALRRAGWQLREIFDSRWGDRRADLAVELALEAGRRDGPVESPES